MIDNAATLGQDEGMDTTEQLTDADRTRAEIAEESAAITEFRATGKPIDPEIKRRIRERAKAIKERVFREHGLVDIAVPAIREIRGEIPK